MYAIVEDGGKQYRVEEGDVIDIELLGVEDGSTHTFKKVLFVNDGETSHVGAPVVEGFSVTGEVVGTSKGPKVKSMKYKKRKNIYRRFGHRQKYSKVRIVGINHGS